MKVIEDDGKLIITKLDRTLRSLIKWVQLLETLRENGIVVEILNLGVIYTSPTCKLIRSIMLCFSEFEHDMIVQKTKDGKVIVRQNSDFRGGRTKKFAIVQINHALKLLETHSYKQIERITNTSITTIYRAKLAKAKTENQQN